MRRFLVVRCKTCDANLIFREVSGNSQRPFIHATGVALCPGCHHEHDYVDEDVTVMEVSEES
jgi:Zn finger protein HypA/HybF involved in hydrogenase expression